MRLHCVRALPAVVKLSRIAGVVLLNVFHRFVNEPQSNLRRHRTAAGEIDDGDAVEGEERRARGVVVHLDVRVDLLCLLPMLLGCGLFLTCALCLLLSCKPCLLRLPVSRVRLLAVLARFGPAIRRLQWDSVTFGSNGREVRLQLDEVSGPLVDRVAPLPIVATPGSHPA